MSGKKDSGKAGDKKNDKTKTVTPPTTPSVEQQLADANQEIETLKATVADHESGKTHKALAEANKKLMKDNKDLAAQVQSSTQVIGDMQDKIKNPKVVTLGTTKKEPIIVKIDGVKHDISGCPAQFRIPGKQEAITREQLIENPEMLKYLKTKKVHFIKEVV